MTHAFNARTKDVTSIRAANIISSFVSARRNHALPLINESAIAQPESETAVQRRVPVKIKIGDSGDVEQNEPQPFRNDIMVTHAVAIRRFGAYRAQHTLRMVVVKKLRRSCP